MFPIKELLLKTKDRLISQELKKETIRDFILKETKIDINIKDIIVKNGVIFLKIKPLQKNIVFLKKDTILLGLKEVLGKSAPKRID